MKKHLINFVLMVMACSLVLGAYLFYNYLQMQKYKHFVSLAQGMTLAEPFKIAIAEFYNNQQKLPSTNEELGFPMAQSFPYPFVTAINVLDNGSIAILYNEQTGVNNGVIKLIPDVSHPESGITWRCITSDYKKIHEAMSVCHFESGNQ